MAYQNKKINSKKGTKRLGVRGTSDQRARSIEDSNSFAHNNTLNPNNLNGAGTNTNIGARDIIIDKINNKK